MIFIFELNIIERLYHSTEKKDPADFLKFIHSEKPTKIWRNLQILFEMTWILFILISNVFIIIFTYLPELNIHIQNGPEVLNMLVPCLNPHWQELWKKKNAHLWRHLWVNFTRLNELGKVSNCSDWCHYSPQKKSAETILSKNNKEIKVPNRPNRVRCIELAWQVLHGQNDDEKRCFLK